MTHLDIELKQLKNESIEMFELVTSQLKKKKDDLLDEINAKANLEVEQFIKTHSDKIGQCLHIISTVRKLERTGDQVKNVAEEIIFYIEAKVLKHLSAKVKTE